MSIQHSQPLAGGQVGGPDSDFVIVEWRDVGDQGVEWIAPLHRHHRDDEAWYVLEGAMRVRVGDEILEAGPGDAVLAPKGVAHTHGNARPGQLARYLLVMTPRIRSLIETLHSPGGQDPARVFADHDSELVK